MTVYQGGIQVAGMVSGCRSLSIFHEAMARRQSLLTPCRSSSLSSLPFLFRELQADGAPSMFKLQSWVALTWVVFSQGRFAGIRVHILLFFGRGGEVARVESGNRGTGR